MKKIRLSVKLLLFCSLFSVGVISAQKYEQTIKDYVNSSQGFQRVNPELKSFKIINVDASKSLKGDVVGIQQTINGIPVFGSSANVLIREGKVLSFADTFIKAYPAAVKGKENNRKDTFVAEAVQKLNGSLTVKNIEGKEEPITTNLVYFAKGGELILGYQFNTKEKETSNVWSVIVSADNGSILYQENTTLSCSFHADAYDHHHSLGESLSETTALPSALPTAIGASELKKNTNFLLAPDNASYNVFAFPVEAPTFGSRTLLTNPWDLTASPEGWHSDGTNHYTITRGNNAFAYTDENKTDLPQFSPDGGASRTFDFPLDVTAQHTTYTSAAVTNLFYTTNKMHDVFYKFGFTESARNYQTNNFGHGGVENDPVLAESRDGSGLSNANFNPGADGTSGRMQMFLFSPTGNVRYLYYNAPSNYTARTPAATTASFGPQLIGGPAVTGDLALSTPADACTAVAAGSLTGKIAVVSAAGCGFAVKTKNLQNAGAVGVIQYHPTLNTPIGMGGADNTITIPTIMVGLSEGQFLVNDLNNGIVGNATLRTDAVFKDASLDNGIISHEYGHGISNRLTGTGSNCLSFISSNEQMGEGWSDFFALMITTKPGDNASVARGIGTFASGEPTTGGGIRPAKYTPDFLINNYTYGRTNGMKISTNSVLGPITVPDSHSIGFIWASMLWDLNWKYVEKYGYNSNVLADPNSGSARVLQLVMDALKLQPCNPSFIDGRNAILAADQASTNGENKCMIWKTFAKRGLGVNASAGQLNGLAFGANQPLPEMSDQVEDFTVPEECGVLAVNEVKNSKGIAIYPNPVRNEFTIQTPSDINLSGITTVSIFDFTGKLISKESINLNKQNTINAEKLINGAYVVKVSNNSIDYTQKIIVSK
ncbi:T9SS-dependent M36 family metallopeptidase [Chryseobacterium arthrosphaerae]|uniref:T9SS-dependent M36 family metallopeptidase n=1 Tax=Chryseobacterium arthrosphaerae TaxID=651561 RepID=UPI001F4B1354|nr:T9SS-dependent M36 family metallopeptidase [Chryseobacterium arthrosphaerae]MDG4650815.1 T9SS-dependent M36 family metallopeptidase [Chryseobacterium arthrosphaerae]